MKRRNAECGKLRRPIKRTKIAEGIYGSSITYLKFIVLWGVVIAADYLLDFRFEFLWPFWLLLRSVYDSFKYQGLAFSVLFVCVAATSDMVCFFFIPVHWLFFLASTYVWVQYVWHTEKGICLPTVALCIFFVYIEAAIRMRDVKQPPFHMDLCRPFAAHCIGYPVVTFGFGFKSYVGYRMRQRRQREVSKENEFYMELLQQALPPRPDPPAMPPAVAIITTLPDKSNRVVCITPNEPDGKLPNGLVVNGVTVTPPITNGSATGTKNSHRKSMDKGPERDRNDSESRRITHAHTNGSISRIDDKKSASNGSISKSNDGLVSKSNTATSRSADSCNTKPDERKTPSNGSVPRQDKGFSNSNSSSKLQDDKKSSSNGSSTTSDIEYYSVNDLDSQEQDKEKNMKGWNNRSHDKGVKGAGKLQDQSNNCLKEKKGRTNKEPQDLSYVSVKDDLVLRLEADVKRLKVDLQASRQTEADLRGQVGASSINERSARSELSQLQGINDDLANRVHGLVTARQADKQNLVALEKKLGDERRARANCETQLATERKNKRQEESALQALALNKTECTESCRQRRRELDSEVKGLRRELKTKEDRMNLTERELLTLRQYKEAQNDTELVMSAFSAIQEKNIHLENSLKAETRIKLDLFSALGEAKRQVEIRDNLIRSQEKELEELKGKMAEVLAVMPSESFCSSPAPLLQATSKFRCFSTADDNYGAMTNLRNLTDSPVSTLDPNATAYTPKNNMVASTEA